MENITSLIRRQKIISLKVFQRSVERTQVVLPVMGAKETTINRLMHAYMVKESATLMIASMKEDGFNPDYKNSIGNVCLVHDIGHPPGGHEGTAVLNARFKILGVFEGFSDNNNNFIVLEKNGGNNLLTSYEWASIIKYPDKLYPQYSKHQLHLLNNALKQDFEYMRQNGMNPSANISKTIACSIMDEADTNSYVTADLADCYSLGYGTNSDIESVYLNNEFFSIEVLKILSTIIASIKSQNKNLIKSAFTDLRIMLSTNYYFTNLGELCYKNEELIKLRDALYSIEKKIFFQHPDVLTAKQIFKKQLEFYIDAVLNGYIPSTTYRKKIEATSSKVEKYRLMRDMIAETTDHYVIEYAQKHMVDNSTL